MDSTREAFRQLHIQSTISLGKAHGWEAHLRGDDRYQGLTDAEYQSLGEEIAFRWVPLDLVPSSARGSLREVVLEDTSQGKCSTGTYLSKI